MKRKTTFIQEVRLQEFYRRKGGTYHFFYERVVVKEWRNDFLIFFAINVKKKSHSMHRYFDWKTCFM